MPQVLHFGAEFKEEVVLFFNAEFIEDGESAEGALRLEMALRLFYTTEAQRTHKERFAYFFCHRCTDDAHS